MKSVTEECSVYLVYTAANELIYVGVTSRSHVRQAQHMVTKAWATEVATTRWEHFPARDQALVRERELITTHAPRYNTTHNPGRLGMDETARREWNDRLGKLGRRRTRLRNNLKTVSAEIAVAAKAAHEAGMPKIDIARAAQISRPALDEILNA